MNAPGRRDPRGLWLLSWLLILPWLTTLYTTWIAPRPYHVRAGYDLEHDIYFRARFLSAGGHYEDTRHPGVPVRWVAGRLMQWIGPEPSRAQEFFNAGYVLMALMTTLTTVMCLRWIRSEAAAWIGPVWLVVSWAWPSFWTYQNQFGTDGFTWIVGAPMLVCVWKAFVLAPGTRWRRLGLAGAWMGLCLATKLTFLPVFVSVGAGIVGAGILRRKGLGMALKEASWWTLCTGVSAWICVWPLWRLMPAELYRVLFVRADSRSDLGRFFREVWPHVWLDSLPYIGLALVFLAGFAVALWRMVRSGNGREDERLETWLAIGTLAVLFVLTVFTARSVEGYPGVTLRNAWPAALFLPWAALHVGRIWRHHSWKRPLLISLVLGGLMTALAAGAVIRHHENRQRADRLAARALTALDDWKPREGRLGIYLEWPPLGEWQFHAYGGNRYGHDLFHRDWLERESRFTWLRARQVHDVEYVATLGQGGAGRRWVESLEKPWGDGKHIPMQDGKTLFVGEGAGMNCNGFVVEPEAWTEAVERTVRRELGDLEVIRTNLVGIPVVRIQVKSHL